jgi:acetoin:2,6-dichlorophenolindophenol oxidoreductase subunit beta
MPRLRMNQAISQALAEEMARDQRVVLMGEDVAAAGGTFKATEGLLSQFGESRVRDTPISEMGFLGAAVGAAMTGLRPVAEIMFVEFFGVSLDELVTEAAQMHYLSGGRLTVPLTVRASAGTGLGFGSQHSQSLERWLLGTPGLKLAVASGARTAYGLLKAAIRDDNPVVILEPRTLYGRREEFDTDEDYLVPLGSGELIEQGSDVTIVALGQTVGRALKASQEAAGWSADIIDLLSLMPWDKELVLASVEKTRRLVTVEENQLTGGWGTEVVSHVATSLFGTLQAPPVRITAPDVHVPYGKELEQRFLPSSTYIGEQVTAFLKTGTAPRHWWEQEAS